MRRRLSGLHSRKIALSAAQGLVASLVMALGVWAWLTFTAGQPVWIVVAGGLLLGGSLYVIVILLLRVEEARSLTKALAQRLRRTA